MDKKILRFILIIFAVNIIFSVDTFSQIINKTNILILASYSTDNEWEKLIIKGIENNLDDKYKIKIEYLDSKTAMGDFYLDTFKNLLEAKYADDNISTIITIDDEAFNLVRTNYFDKNYFLYQKPIIFVGVNSQVNLSEEESNYITGIFELQENKESIQVMLNTDSSIDTINVILDKSIYSQVNKENIIINSNYFFEDIKFNLIQNTYIKEVQNGIKNYDSENSVFYIMGTYLDEEGNELSEKETLDIIKKISRRPIFSKVLTYVEEGCVGGIVNDGERLGSVTAQVLPHILEEKDTNIIIPSHETINTPIFNFKAIREYNINPTKLPENSIYLNRGKFDLLISEPAEFAVKSITLTSLFAILVIIVLYIIDKKKLAKHNMLLFESEERNKIKTEYLITVSHELRTPLNIIMNSAKLLTIKIDNDDIEGKFFKEKLQFIIKSSNRLLRYVNNLIDANKFQLGYNDISLMNENIISIVEETTLAVIDYAHKYNMEVIFDTDSEEVILAIDKNKIEKVILNLLSNAIKFGKEGGKIMVVISNDENAVTIKVADNGIGIPEEVQPFVFDKFKRVESVSELSVSNEGSGLGLYIAKKIIEAHQGTISVTSKENIGTTFTIVIPKKTLKNNISNNSISTDNLDRMSQLEMSDLDKK